MKPLARIVLTSVLTVVCIHADSAATAGCHGRSGGYSGGRHFGGGSYARIPHYNAPVYSHPRRVVIHPPQVIYAPAPLPPQPMPAPTGLPEMFGEPPMPVTGSPGTGNVGISFSSSRPGSGPAPVSVTSPTAPPSGSTVSPPSSPPSGPASLPSEGSADQSAEQSALAALGGFAPPQVPAESPRVVAGSESGSGGQTFVGSWTARPGNGATIRLTLAADGRFEWSAVNATGRATTFQGSYTIENGSLSLARSNDSQRLTGRMTTSSADTFNFQLADDNAAKLEFRRS